MGECILDSKQGFGQAVDYGRLPTNVAPPQVPERGQLPWCGQTNGNKRRLTAMGTQPDRQLSLSGQVFTNTRTTCIGTIEFRKVRLWSRECIPQWWKEVREHDLHTR